MANQWFRLYSEFSTDPKVQMLSEAQQRRLIMLFCIRCNSEIALDDGEIAFQLRILPEEWQTTKALFVKKGFIDKANKILNWDKRQYISDTSTERVKRFRKRHETVSVTPPEQIQNRTDTEQKGKKDISSLIFKENAAKGIRARIKAGEYVGQDDKKLLNEIETEIKNKLKAGEL